MNEYFIALIIERMFEVKQKHLESVNFYGGNDDWLNL